MNNEDREAYVQATAAGLRRAVELALGVEVVAISQDEVDRLWKRLRDAFRVDSLDAAWAEALATTPEGYILCLSAMPNHWVHATAASGDDKHDITAAEHTDDPAVALRSLTAYLRSR